MSFKDIFLKPDPDAQPEMPSHDDVKGSVLPHLPSRPVQRVPSTLNPGPSTSLFERTTGGFAGPSNVPQVTQVDKQFDDAIMGYLDRDSKEPGYKEFALQYNTLSAYITDKAKCTEASLAAVVTANPRLTASQIVKSIGERLRLLSEYQSAYEADAKRNEDAENRDKTTAISQAQSTIQDLDAEISRLQGERNATQSRLDSLRNELSGVTHKYDGYRTCFKVAVTARSEELTKFSAAITSSTK